MRLVPKAWSNETWVCSIRGHLAPAARVVRLRPEDARLGIEVPGGAGARLVRCLRCDGWVECPAPTPGAGGTTEVLPPVADLPKPRRGEVLQDAVTLRVIAVIKGFHAAVFGLLSLALAVLTFKLPGMQASAQTLNDQLHSVAEETGRAESRDLLVEALHRVVGLHRSVLTLLLVTAVVYFVMETIETIGLWKERRWAEYLTVMATAGLLPFEVRELWERVTFFRLTALVVNLAILVWLVWVKRLFGLRGGRAALQDRTDWNAIIAGPSPAS
jgi:uncharacterized membrane protein (DUF2068 family)